MKTILNLNDFILTLPNNSILIDKIDLIINYGDKIGIIGDNGSGKTSLIKEITNNLSTNDFSVFFNTNTNSSRHIIEFIEGFEIDFWKLQSNYFKIFKEELNISLSLGKLSGGQRVKLHLTICLSKSCNFFILDEPTNDLDEDSIKNLIEFIHLSKKSFLIVSHDIEFLNKTINQVWSIENKKLSKYTGIPSEYLEKKELEQLKQKQLLQGEKKRLFKLKSIAKQKEDQSKSTHLKIARDPYLKKKAGRKAKVAKVLKQRIEKESNEINSKFQIDNKKDIFITFKNTQVNHELVLELKEKHILVRDKVLLENIHLEIYGGDRVLLKGKNGTGKTTLLEYLIKNNKDKNVLYLDQNYSLINKDLSIIENIECFNRNYGYEEIRKELGNYLFYSDEIINKKAGNLSSGELTRLTLAILSVNRTDLIILDEPTNNLDVSTMKILISALNKYKGAFIVVSHNLYFINEIKFNRFLNIKNQEIYQHD
jgi:ATPase subunit of ABC transporter with duplicated ATPase domains